MLSREAQGLDARGELGQAYLRALRAYEVVRGHEDDPDCRAFAEGLLGKLGQLEAELDRQSAAKPGGDLSHRPLIDVAPDE